MAVDRRFILMTGAAAVVVAGAGWALTREPKAARAPWRKASEGFGDARLDILAYAILAPNPHNMQPWRIRLEGDDAFTLYCDKERLLPETDPPNRQITIGFGCFLELANMAAAEKGYRLEIDPFPMGEPFPTLDDRPIARAQLIRDDDATRDGLFSTVLTRRTNRAPFDLAAPVDDETLAAIKDAARRVDAKTSSDPALVETLRALTIDAWRTEWMTPQTRRESVIVTRIGKAAINENPYGIAVSGPMMEALKTAGFVTQEKIDEPGATAFEQSLSFYEEACASAMAYAWITTPENTRLDQLNVGRAWVRMQLAANALGVGFHPLSQALQEFPEMAGHYARAHELLAPVQGHTVQMLSRLGFAKAPPVSPREPLMAQIIAA
ncbi:MAG: twin-arginine translocation pathway signal protein [Pseudomonadota bacterium]